MKPIVQNRERLAGRLDFFLVLIAGWLIFAAPSMAGVVTNTADSGPGTLRQEILDANADDVPTLITFDASVFPETIFLATRLPAIRGVGDSINTAGLEVVIDGSAVSDAEGRHAIGLRIMAADVTVRGLTIKNFANDGIYVGPSQSDNGTDITQVMISGNTLINNLDGLHVTGNMGPNNLVQVTIASNRLDSNRDDGISVDGSPNNSTGQNEVSVVIAGNHIVGSLGVVTGGTITGDGIRVLGGRGNGSNNRIFADLVNNVILKNIDDGIVVAGAGGGAAANNTIETTILNNRVRANGAESSTNGNGIVVRGGSRGDAVSPGNDNSLLFEVSGNRSIGNKDSGILVTGGLGSGNILEGDVLSNHARQNGWDGLRVTGASGTANRLLNIRVEQNRIARNLRDGINVNGGSGGASIVESVSLVDNRIFLNDRFGIVVASGQGSSNAVSVDSIIGNRSNANSLDGIFVATGVSGAGETPIESNRCSLNAQDGINIDSTGYALSKNRAFFNAGDGINAVGNINGGGNIAMGNASCNTPGCF